MQVLSIRWYAKYGHFLRAEANANALSYPVPPRTAVLGMIAALLGLEKDTLPEKLDKTLVAIGGTLPQRFWHRIKLRKNLPAALPFTVKKGQKGSSGTDESPKLVLQEWLWQPDYQVHIAMPDNPSVFSELSDRIAKKRWHFSPYMGLSELLADVEFISISEATRKPAGKVKISSIFPQTAGRILNSGEKIHLLRMPHRVNSERIFSHQGYYLEHRGHTLTVETDQAWEIVDIKPAIMVVFD
jgi:CRISPR-associated protein Cas5h